MSSPPPPAPAGEAPSTPRLMDDQSVDSPASISGVTRTRDQFDADSGDDTSVESPHPPKLARTESDANMDNDDPTALALIEELECGMCAGVFIDPVALNGCGHVFCGSCVQQWIKSIPRYPVSLLPGDPVPEPIACPHCRHAPIQTATPSRVAKSMVTFLLGRMPSVSRPPNELRQAKDIYTSNHGVLKFPVPPPPPRAPMMSEFWRPCRSCYPTEEGAWKCPVPVPRFDVPAERELCIRADGIPPDGHRLCAGCERLSPCAHPKSANCGICGEGFCGEVPSGCECVPMSQSKTTNHFNNFSNVLADCPSDMLALAFKDNWNEMTYLSNFIAEDETGRDAPQIYQTILAWLRTPEGVESGGVVGMMNRADINLRLRTGMTDELQKAIMAVGEGATEAKICGGCADEILCAGILEWWMRELKKPEVANSRPAAMKERPNCKFGRKCSRQENDRHAKKFNHICEALSAEEAAQIHQDDTMPASANEDAIVESDDDSDDDDKPPQVDVSTQWEATPEAETRLVISIQEPIKAKWLSSTPTTAVVPPIIRTSSPRVSGSASSPLAQSFSWPTLSSPNATRAETPPLGVSLNANIGSIGSADSELAVTAAKLTLPMSPTPGKCVPTEGANMMQSATAMDIDA